MRKIRIVCKGSFPLMMDQMPDAVLDSLATKVKLQIKNDRSHEEVAAEKIYRNDDGKIGLPVTMLYAALVTAGREVAYKGRANISTAETTKLFGLIEIPQEFLQFPIPDGKTEVPWVVDKRRGILRAGGNETAVCLRRPKFKDWGFTCEVIYDDDEINEETVAKLFRLAGRFQGLGSFRPNCKGPFGRYVVESLVDITPAEWIAESKRNKSSRKVVVDESVAVNEDETGDGDLIAVGGNGEGKAPRKGRLTGATA